MILSFIGLGFGSLTLYHLSSDFVMLIYLTINYLGLYAKFQESKLNPSAKVFSPSFPNYRSTPPPVATVPSVAYVSNNFPAVQVAGAQPELIRPIAPRSSWPVKFVSYVSSTAMNADNGLQYNQPVCLIWSS